MRLALQSIILNKNDSDRLFPRIDLAHQRATFGEDLIEAPVCALHRVEYAMDVLDRNVLVEQVTHRIDEDEL